MIKPKFSLEALSHILPVLDEVEQRGLVGGGNGSYSNPYIRDEYLSKVSNCTWSGGYVSGMGYVGANDSVSWNSDGSAIVGSGTESSPYSAYTFDNWNGYWSGGYVSGMGYVPNTYELVSLFENSLEHSSGYSYCGYNMSDLSNDERSFIMQHSQVAYSYYQNSNKAFLKTQGLSGQHNGYGDAIRHCYWSALNMISNSKYAEIYGTAHENKPNQPLDEKGMDLHNNSVGYSLGKRALMEGWDENRLYQECLNAARDGKLQMLSTQNL